MRLELNFPKLYTKLRVEQSHRYLFPIEYMKLKIWVAVIFGSKPGLGRRGPRSTAFEILPPCSVWLWAATMDGATSCALGSADPNEKW
jgi:hypothetical protein